MFKVIKRRWPRFVNSKAKVISMIAFVLVLLFCLTFIPIRMWLYSGIATRGITSIRGESMAPTIQDNEILFVDVVNLERGSIVMANLPNGAINKAFLKRIIGLPGETVKIKADGVYINDVLLDEPYCSNVDKTFIEDKEYNEVILSDGEYYLLGDNREKSYDSRYVGPFTENLMLYTLTKEPNSYTKLLMFTAGCLIVLNILLLIVLPYVLFLLMTIDPNAKSKEVCHIKTKMVSKSKAKSNKSKRKKRNNKKKK